MIDMVGDDNTQIPPTIQNDLILIDDSKETRLRTIKSILAANRGKKILIFLDTKQDVRSLESENMLALHGDIN